jgi:hypothetical protein
MYLYESLLQCLDVCPDLVMDLYMWVRGCLSKFADLNCVLLNNSDVLRTVAWHFFGFSVLTLLVDWPYISVFPHVSQFSSCSLAPWSTQSRHNPSIQYFTITEIVSLDLKMEPTKFRNVVIQAHPHAKWKPRTKKSNWDNVKASREESNLLVRYWRF